MAGQEHVSADHETLRPTANVTTIPIGDVDEWGTNNGTRSKTKPFLLEKYIAINGEKYVTTEAIDKIKNDNDSTLNISDVYPGTLSKVTDANGRVVGLEGELGVRYGLQLSIVLETGNPLVLFNAEVDSLDVKVSQVAPLSGDSKLLYCLVNKLVQDDTYKLLVKYIFPFSKFVSMLAIYNDMGFLPSIGEVVVPIEDTYGTPGTPPRHVIYEGLRGHQLVPLYVL